MAELMRDDRNWSSAAAERFERAWTAGPRPRIEDFVVATSGAARAGLLAELLRVERELRRRAGEQPTTEEYRRRFPEHGAVIDAVFSERMDPSLWAGDRASTATGEPATASFGRSPEHSVLDRLAETIGSAPRVLLRDTEAGHETPVVRPLSSEMPGDSGRYQVLGEIAQGGMGAIFKGRDPDLGRDVAMKILLGRHHNDPEMTHRFVEEAQIGGQLQHPGIVPVYELGQLGDRRPYFTMKLVKGRTLAALLAARETPTQELPRFLGIFEQVCQTMAYAHARGVIHRDLKPSNIMVGSFGEVQVMDWGLAKVLPRGGIADEPRVRPAEPAVSIIHTVRSGSDADASHAGVALGTPAYMAPEQAGGDIEAIDERVDVFGLGSILCELITGRPAYTGQSSEAILRKAMRGDMADALRRLDDCGADAELVTLARHCLAAEREERPGDAGEVTRRLSAYLAGVQERLKAAELARAAEQARAEEAQATAAAAQGRARAERRARRMTVGLAASLFFAAALGAAGWRWVELDRVTRTADTVARVNTALQEATRLKGQAEGAPVGDLTPWVEALAAAKIASDLLDHRSEPALRRQVDSLLAAIAAQEKAAAAAARAAESDHRLLDRLIDIRSARTDDPDGAISEADFTRAFREAGIDVVALPPGEAAARMKARPAMVAVSLAAALDDWAALRRNRRNDAAGANRLTTVAREADPDSWRNQLRDALEKPKGEPRTTALHRLARSAARDNLPAVSLDLLGLALLGAGDLKTAETVLRQAQRRYPGDVWLNHDLAWCLERLERRDEAIRYYTAARSIRPETAHELAHALEGKGESDEAIAVFQDLVRLRPDGGRHWGCYGRLLRERGDRPGSQAAIAKADSILRETIRHKPDASAAHYSLGWVLRIQGRLEEAVAEYREVIRLHPDDAAAHHTVGIVLEELGKREEAIAEYRTAIRLHPDDAAHHTSLGVVLQTQARLVESIAEFRAAIRLQPNDARAHYSLGRALDAHGEREEALAEFRASIRHAPASSLAHYGAGWVLQAQGKLADAIAEYREVIRLAPDNFPAHSNLAGALLAQGKTDEAIAAYREFIRLKPDDALAHRLLGSALRAQGKPDEAAAEYQEAIRLNPDDAAAHDNLGALLCDVTHDYEAAVAEFRTVLRLAPDHAGAHYNLGNALRGQGKLEEAIDAYREAIRRKPDHAEAHCNLGHLLRGQGRFTEALDELERGHALGSQAPDWSYPSAEWVRQARRLAELAPRLPAILRGKDRPANAEESLALAGLCYEKKIYGASARFSHEAFQAQPALAEDGEAGHRYNAACAAALAGSGQGKDEPPLDDATRAHWRKQALDWLKADLARWTVRVEAGTPQTKLPVAQMLRHWKDDSDLAGIRDEADLAKLPADQKKACRALWSEVDALLAKIPGRPSKRG